MPVEMAVLSSHQFQSQNGMVGATKNGNIPAVE
jgi:hypothetical protein